MTHYTVTVIRTVRGQDQAPVTWHLVAESIEGLLLKIRYKACPKRLRAMVGIDQGTQLGHITDGNKAIATFTYTVGGPS